MDKKKIIVFWDNKGIAKALKENKEFIVCVSQNEFHNLSKKALKEARGFLVLCELNWNHEKAYVHRTEFGGIRLVQRFIRDKMNLKVPVVFTSSDTAKNICEANPENKIIRTPALKHFFVDIRSLDNPTEDLYHCFDLLENVKMTDTELAYTKLLYCDERGVLVQINHKLNGRSKFEQNNYCKDIEYILKEVFHSDAALMEEYHNTKDLGNFCKVLLTRFDSSDTQKTYDGFFQEQNHKTIRILFLEDEPEKSDVSGFINYINDLEKKAVAKKNDPLFRITIVKNIDNVAFNKTAGRKRYYLNDFDVVICDIEIRNDKDELVTLGFNVIEAMAKESKRPLYYIVTNVSRSFYDQIKNPYIRRIRLKEEVFGTKESIETFLYGIKEVYDNREFEAAEKETKSEMLFNKLFYYVNKDIYPKQFGKPFIEDGASLMIINSYDDLENSLVKVKTLELIKHYLTLFEKRPFKYKTGEGGGENFIRFDENCKLMRDYIKATIGLGNENLGVIIAEREKKGLELTIEDISNFVVNLILRRFFLYVKGFIDYFSIMQSFEDYIKQNHLDEYNKRRKLTKNDLACRAIGDQFKTLRTEHDLGQDQSHCLGENLLFAVREPLRITEEEKAFVKALGSKSYPTAKSSISKLRIDY